LRRILDRCRAGSIRVRDAIRNPTLSLKLPWLLIGAVALFDLVFVYRRGVDTNWDLRNYHFYNGYALVHWRFDTDIAPAGQESYLNPIPCAFFYLLLTAVPFPADAWILMALQLCSLPILVLIVREIDREFGHETSSVASLLALCLCIAAPIWWSEQGTTFYSSTTAPLVLLGLLLALRGIRMASIPQPELVRFAMAGLAIGFASGLKLTNAPFAIGLMLAVAMVLFPLDVSIAVRDLACYVAGLVVGFAPTSWWNIYLFRRWGSPLYPFYNSIFRAPYFPAMNFRDLRFVFHSFAEFVNFLFAATRETHVTLELRFADARLLMFVVLMVVVSAAWISRSLGYGKTIFGNPPTRVTAAFLWFFSVSFVLWAVVFAYERYLIPIEVLFGITIWILVAQLTTNQHRIVAAMAILLMVSLATIEAPDWGHWTGEPHQPHLVGIDIPKEVAATPADYLIYGKFVSYVLPLLNPDSRFFGITFIPQRDPLLDAQIKAALADDRIRPIRLLTKEDDLAEASAQVETLGLRTERNCRPIQSDFDRLLVCGAHARDPFGFR
jgi:hypothetical protein